METWHDQNFSYLRSRLSHDMKIRRYSQRKTPADMAQHSAVSSWQRELMNGRTDDVRSRVDGAKNDDRFFLFRAKAFT